MQRACDFFITPSSQHNCYINNEDVKQPQYSYCYGIFGLLTSHNRKDLQFLAKQAILKGQVDYDFNLFERQN